MVPTSQLIRRFALLTATLLSLLIAAVLPAAANSRPASSLATPPAPSEAAPSDAAQPAEPVAPTQPAATPSAPAPRSGSGPPGSLPSDSRASAQDGDPRAGGAQVYTGTGFDTCQAPSATAMHAWKRSSPFGAVGVYIGGRARGCPNQTHLNADWVRGTSADGWRLLPVYVGSQAPCVVAAHKRKFAMNHSDPAGRGGREGRDAVARAKALRMAPGSALYLDMEAYRQSDAQCAATTLNFIQGWNRAVRAAGYLPGFYSSADSGIAHLARARRNGAGDLPEAVWFARWGSRSSVDGEKQLAPGAWSPHRRIHQYQGNVSLTYGGHRLMVDRNTVDAPVAVVR